MYRPPQVTPRTTNQKPSPGVGAPEYSRDPAGVSFAKHSRVEAEKSPPVDRNFARLPRTTSTAVAPGSDDQARVESAPATARVKEGEPWGGTQAGPQLEVSPAMEMLYSRASPVR